MVNYGLLAFMAKTVAKTVFALLKKITISYATLFCFGKMFLRHSARFNLL